MKDKLRQLAERWSKRIGGEPTTTITSKEVCELMAILDAKDGGGAVQIPELRIGAPAWPGQLEGKAPPEGWVHVCVNNLPTHPHSPDAADSGRVTRDVLAIGVRARNIEITRQQRAGEPNNEDHALRIGIAAAFAAQGEAVACIDPRHLALLRKDWRQGNCLKPTADAVAGDVMLYTLSAPPASPAGVPDNCLPFTNEVIDKMQDVMADHGFVVPVRVISDAFNTTRVALRADAPSATPEGGEVGR